MPKKPSRPLSHIIFPKAGTPSVVSEVLPEPKDDLEAVIVRKFITALEHRFDRHLTNPEKDDPWPDFWTSEGGRPVGIEVVEIVNPEHIEFSQIRRRYVERWRAELSNQLDQLPGLVLEIEGGYQFCKYPPVNSV